MDLISGEKIQALADVVIASEADLMYNPIWKKGYTFKWISSMDADGVYQLHAHAPNLAIIRIFIYGHRIDAFFKSMAFMIQRPYILISHNSDASAAWQEEAPSMMKKWFGQNVSIPHPLMSPLPIGFANSMWPHGRLDIVASAMENPVVKKILCYMNFSVSTAPDYRQFSIPSDLVTHVPTVSYDQYIKILSQSIMAICPRGNGLDTHRFWECIALDVIPIVKKGEWMDQFRDHVYVIEVDTWTQVTNEFIETYAVAIKQSKQLLDMNYWRNQLVLKTNSTTSGITSFDISRETKVEVF